jgi:hypothetical protein
MRIRVNVFKVSRCKVVSSREWGGGKETDQSEFSLAIPHTVSIAFDMAFWD